MKLPIGPSGQFITGSVGSVLGFVGIDELAALPPILPASSSCVWVDGNSTNLEENGTIGAPYHTLTAALNDRASTGATVIFLSPFDYSDGEIYEIAGGVAWHFIGPSLLDTRDGTSVASVIMPELECSVPPTSLLFQGVEFPSSGMHLAGQVFCIGCLNIGLSGTCSAVISGGSVGGSITIDGPIQINNAVITIAGFLQSGAAYSSVIGCIAENTIAFEFSGAPGVLYYDTVTQGWNSNNPPVVSNGIGYRLGIPYVDPLPSITGVTEQEQIDSIVAAGVLYNFWVDNR